MAAQPVFRSNPVKGLWKPEFIETMTFSQSAELSLSANAGQIPRDRYLSGLLIQWRGRITNAGSNNPTSLTAGGIYNLLNKVRVYGKHRIRRNDDTICNLSGVNLAEISRLYRRLDPTGTGTLVVTASATMDVVANLVIPFVPLGVSPAEQRNYLLDAPNYDTLYLKIDTGSYASCFSGHTTDGTISAYGSASGNASINVYRLIATEPAGQWRGFMPGVISRYSVDCINATLQSSNAGVRLFNLPKGNALRGLILKTGTLKTGMGALRAFASLSDDLVSNVVVNRGTNRRVWDAKNFWIGRELAAINRGIASSTGYLPIDWVNNGAFSELFDTSSMVAGATGEVDFYMEADVVGASNQIAELIVEDRVKPPQFT